MKSWSIVLAGGFLLFLTSAIPNYHRPLVIGEKAPILENAAGTDMIGEQHGKYVVLNFWSASDALSRIKNATYDRIEKNSNGKFLFISINTDKDTSLYQQIIKVDGIKVSGQYSCSDVKIGKITENYNLDRGNKAYLINPDGIIVAINPNENQLTELI